MMGRARYPMADGLRVGQGRWTGRWTGRAWGGAIDYRMAIELLTDGHYRALFDAMAQGVVYQEADGRIVAANPAAERILGLTVEQMQGRTPFDPRWKAVRADGSDFPGQDHPATVALRTGLPVRGVVMGVFHPREETYRWISVDATPLFGPGHEAGREAPRLACAVLDDITERRRAEESSRQATARLSAVLDVLQVAVVIADARGALAQVNEAARELWGEVPLVEGVEGYRAYRGWWPETGRPVEPEEWAMARALRDGEVCAGEEILIETFDGERKTILNTAAPIRDDVGAIVGGVAAIVDITARKRLERRTQESLTALLAMAQSLVSAPADDDVAAQTDVAAEALPDTTWAVAHRLIELTRSVVGCRRVSITAHDAATGASYPLAVVGVTPEEERAWREGRSGASLREYLDLARLERLMADDILVVGPEDLPGRHLPYEVRTLLLAPMRVGRDIVGVLSLDHGGVVHTYTPDELALTRAVAKLGALVIERDRLLREREQARAGEAALREANRRMDTFLGIAGHEMRTPLTTIKGTIQVVRRRLARLAERDRSQGGVLVDELRQAEALLARGEAQAGRLDRLVDDLLDVSRTQAGHLAMSVQPADLSAIVREVVDEQRELAANRTIDQQGEAGVVPVPVNVDPGRIGQVLTNYISNALRYSPPERPVTVGLVADGDSARVWVRDEGPGLPPGEQERIWDRFYRVAGIEHRHGSSMGLGLGLYISRTIVERHGGQVGVESVPDEGATFWFTLPLSSPPVE